MLFKIHSVRLCILLSSCCKSWINPALCGFPQDGLWALMMFQGSSTTCIYRLAGGGTRIIGRSDQEMIMPDTLGFACAVLGRYGIHPLGGSADGVTNLLSPWLTSSSLFYFWPLQSDRQRYLYINGSDQVMESKCYDPESDDDRCAVLHALWMLDWMFGVRLSCLHVLFRESALDDTRAPRKSLKFA